MKSILNHFSFILFLFVFFACSEQEDTVPPQEKDFCSSLHPHDSLVLGKRLDMLKDSMMHKTGVYVLEDGGGSMMARAWFSEQATKSIDIQYFIFSTDNVGLIACDYLVRAADRGVKVRILVDDILVEAGVHDILTLDSHPNIDIRIYNPGINLGKNIVQKLNRFANDFRGANQRMHNKTFVVDGRVVITGGRNIADEYFDYDHAYNFRDRDVLLIGKTSETVQQSFNTFWASPLSVPVTDLVDEKDHDFSDPHRFDRLHQYACNPDNFWPQVREGIRQLPQMFDNILQSGKMQWIDSVDFYSDLPGKNTAATQYTGGISTSALIKLVQEAKVSIDIQSPYLITTKLGKQIFKEAVDRGVKVRILTNSLASTDNLEAFSGYKRDRETLLKTGVRIFEWRPDAAIRYKVMTGALQKQVDYKPVFGWHAKSMVVDGHVVVIGTFNLDPRSANLNTECVTVIHSRKIASEVGAGMEEEFKPENAWETTLNFNPDSVAGKAKNLKVGVRRLVPKGIL